MSNHDFDESPEAARWRVLLTTVSLACGGLATLAVLLRLYACRKTGVSIRSEDNLMVIAVVLMWGSTAGALLKAYNGIGVPSDQLPESRATLLGLGSWLIPKFWSTSMACSKISIIVFINRAVTLSRRVNIALFLVALCVYGYTGVVFFFSFFMCQPVAYYWNKSIPNGSCVSNRTYMIQNIATAIVALLTDVAILLVPMPAILRLKLQKRRKFAVISVFSMGSIICVFSLLRVVQFFTFNTDHISTSSALETVWTLLENDWSIICGCAPQVASLFQSFRESAPYAMGYSGSYNPYGIAFRYPKTVIKTTVSGRTDSPSCNASMWNRNSSEVELRGIEVHTAINQEISRASQLYSKDRVLISRLATI